MDYPNWFAPYVANFEQHLTTYRGQPNLRFLQLGAYTGDCSLWLAHNILTHPTSELIDVDTWGGSNETLHHDLNFQDIYTHYRNRVTAHPVIKTYRMTTVDYFLTTIPWTYDFVYIDADHTASSVATDAVLSWRGLKPGGILAFDDYLWRDNYTKQYLHPRPAIDAFLEAHDGQYETLTINAQVWIRKNKKEGTP